MSIAPSETLQIDARELLAQWATVVGPDLRRERRPGRRPGTLALAHLPTYKRQLEARRGTATSVAGHGREDASPPSPSGLETVWSANAPPVMASA